MSSVAHGFGSVEFWIGTCFDFSTVSVCRKQKQIFDIQNSTGPNRWAAEDNSFTKKICSFKIREIHNLFMDVPKSETNSATRCQNNFRRSHESYVTWKKSKFKQTIYPWVFQTIKVRTFFKVLSKGVFNNYMDRILPFFDPLRGQFLYSERGQKTDMFWPPSPPPSSCPRSY